MALTKVQAEGINLADTFAFTGTISGVSFAGTGAFSARFSSPTSWQTISDGSIMPYNDDSTGDSFDTDSNYNTSTYKYTAPAAGVYLFWYTIYTANSDANNEFSLLKNSTKIDYTGGSDDKLSSVNGEDDDHIQHVSVVIPLSANDTIAVVAAQGSDYYPPHCAWGGCRLA